MRFLLRKVQLKNKRGSFLLEALLAVLILSVGLVGLIRGLLSSLNAAKQAQDYTRAISFADNALLEVVRLNGQKASWPVVVAVDNKDIRVEVDMIESNNLEMPQNLKQVQVKIKWPAAAKQKEINAMTLVFGPSDENK